MKRLWGWIAALTCGDKCHRSRSLMGVMAITDLEPWEFKDGHKPSVISLMHPCCRKTFSYLPSGPFEWHFNEQTPCRLVVTPNWLHLDTYSGFAWCAMLHCTVWSNFQNIFTENVVTWPSPWAHGIDWPLGRLGQAMWLSWVVLCQPRDWS